MLFGRVSCSQELNTLHITMVVGNTNNDDGRFQGRIIRALANPSGVYQYSCHLCTLSSFSIAAVLYVLIQGPLTRGGRSSFGSTSECYSKVV